MRTGHWLQVIAALALVLQLGTAQAASAGLLPVIPFSQGEELLSDPAAHTAFMRRDHMEVLKHQRDETMQRGIRTQVESLQNCLACHARDEQGQPVSASAPGQFCSTCHEYAAVKIDCFGCHTSLPTPGLEPVGGDALISAMPSGSRDDGQ